MDLSSVNYVRQEYLFSGNATGYASQGKLSRDGIWSVKESQNAAYKTRMVVIRPKDPSHFNGTVYVEWFNVTGGVDAGPVWISGHNQIIRSGAAWVGVTAQSDGVNGGTATVESKEVAIPQGGLVKSDPVRYGSLTHPGDLFSYDIFTQAGVTVRGDAKGVKPMQGYDVKHVLAVGQSQSAARLVTYVDGGAATCRCLQRLSALQPSRHSGTARCPFVNGNDPSIPTAALIRTDINVPVFTFETEYDVSVLKYADARQPNSKYFRVWEMAGGSHEDAYSGGGYALTDLGNGEAEKALFNPAKADGGELNCVAPINAGDAYAPLQAAMSDLDAWVSSGPAPPEFPEIQTTGTGAGIDIVRNDLGIAKRRLTHAHR